MLRNKLVRSDGSIIDSSTIISCDFTEEVNSSTNLTVGNVTSSELAVEILSTNIIEQGEVLSYYIIEDGVESLIGIFNAEKPTVATRTSMRFTAYDNIVKTEKIFSDWLRENQSLFPLRLLELVQYTCSFCGVGLATTDFPQAHFIVNAFYADGLTCRQILSWAAAMAGRFVRVNTEGKLEFAWYSDIVEIGLDRVRYNAGASLAIRDDGQGYVEIESDNINVIDDGAGNLTLLHDGLKVSAMGTGVAIEIPEITTMPYFRDKLSFENYTTDLVERVQINHGEDDVGIIYPPESTGNCFIVSGNMILGSNPDEAEWVARHLYEQLQGMRYTPFNVTIPRTMRIRAGDKIRVSADAVDFVTYVMRMSVSKNGTVLSATGDMSYGSNAAASSEKYTNLTGKILTLTKNVDGLVVKNEDLEGRVAGLELTTDSFKTYVEGGFVSGDTFEQYKTEAEQTAQEFIQRFEGLDQWRNQTTAHIRTGALYYTDDNIPVYGMEIGQQTEVEGEEVFSKYAQFTTEKLSFFDQSGDEVAQIGDKKMSVTNVEITGSHDGGSRENGTFKQGSFIDIALRDGTIVTKWLD